MPVELAPFPPDQVDLLETWLAAPHVQRWWKPHWTAPVVAAFRNGEPLPDWLRALRIDLDGRPIGYAHDYDALSDGDVWRDVDGVGPGTRGLDLLIGEADVVNRKVGREVIRHLTARLFADAGCDRVVVDPHPDHWGAIIAFKKAGYREKGRRMFPSGLVMVLSAARAVWKA